MPDPEVSQPASDHEINRRRFCRRLFHWGIGFWVLAWILSMLVFQRVEVNLKGLPSMDFGVSAGSIMMDFEADPDVTSNSIRWQETSFLWSEQNLKSLREYPGAYILVIGFVRWNQIDGRYMLAFPIAGFLWLWLLGGWLGDFKKPQRTKFWRKRHLIGRASILVSIPLIVLSASCWLQIIIKDKNGPQLCILKVRNIQQAMRSHSGVRGLAIGSPIKASDLIGLGKYLRENHQKCPNGQLYRMKSHVTEVGEVFAECPNPEHQRRLKEYGTSNW